MRLEAYTAQGEQILLENPITIVMNRDEQAPADDFTGIFPFQALYPTFQTIKLFSRKQLIFYGIVDEQTVQLTQTGGYTLKIIARSRAALLIDNEALPQTYINPSLKTIFERHAKPYGFGEVAGNCGAFRGEMRIAKGMSEWQVLQNFCNRFMGVNPIVTLDGKVDATGTKSSQNLIFSNLGGGIPYLSLKSTRRMHSLISEICIQPNQKDTFSYKMTNKQAVSLGIVRRRYKNASGNAYQTGCKTMKLSKRNWQEWEVICAGYFEISLGNRAEIEDCVFGKINSLSVAKITYWMDHRGEFCRVTLRKEVD